jgi:purine nucleoside permease
VHHWCGNDSIGLHWARVDVERLLCYRGEARTANAAWQRVLAAIETERPKAGHEWDPGDQGTFVQWCRLIDDELSSTTKLR